MTTCPCSTMQAAANAENASDFADCCEPFLNGSAQPATAEALMRSRYTAFCKADLAYLVKTIMPAQQEGLDRDAILRWASESEWLGLEIHKTEAGQADDTLGYVAFSAHFKRDGKKQVHKERSSFRRVEGAWYYDDVVPVSVETFVRGAAKVGRNDPCPCGSGRKFKKCCEA